MMRIEIASNIQTNSSYGDRRAAAAARGSEEKQSANADAGAAEVKNSSWGLKSSTPDRAGSIRDEAAPVQSPAPVEETYNNASSSTPEGSPARTEDNLKDFVSELTRLSQMSKNRLEFEFDSEDQISVIRVVDKETGELVWRIPPKKLLAAIDHIFNTQGVVLNKTA